MTSRGLPARTRSDARKLIFELTNLCNFSCVHCIRDEDGPKHYLGLEIIEKVLREAGAYRSFHLVYFTGGEPTVHPRFADIIERVVGHDYSYGFVTNGWNFDKILRRIEPFKEHLHAVNLSLDGAREETHDALRRRPGSFRRVMQAVSLCRFHRLSAHINMVVTTANRSEVEEMALLAGRLGCETLNYVHCQPTPDALAAGLVLSPRERRRVEAEIGDLQKTFQLEIVLAGDHYQESLFYQCPQLQMRELNIDYRGFLTACCMLSNYRGGAPDTDVVADLNEVSLFEAHRRLVARFAELNAEKIDRLATVDATETDHFICSHCLQHYQKLAEPERTSHPALVQIGTP
ncbi:MAG: radical SAM protein [bacterium]|nr:radical SAM protein [bacterium]